PLHVFFVCWGWVDGVYGDAVLFQSNGAESSILL
ncbi:MAG: hypothetical protein RIR45_1267, partial [Pseudomonadota bacterium]